MVNLNHKRLAFQTFQTKCISNFLKNWDINQAAGVDNLYDRFFKDGANIFIMPIT